VTLLLVGLFLMLGEVARAYVMGDEIALRQRKRLVVEWPVAAVALVFLVVFVVPAALEMIYGRSEVDARRLERGVIASVIVDLLIFASVLVVLAMTGKNRLSDYGVDLQGWRGEVRAGALAYLATIPLVILVMQGMSRLRGPETVHPFLRLLETAHDRTIVAVVFAGVVAAPLAEELIFRVLFQGLLESLLPAWLAILIPALTFAAVHGRYDALPLLPLAIILGIVYHRRRSYVAVFTLHAMFNATFLVLQLMFR